MNFLLLVIDSLRADAVYSQGGMAPPFFERFASETICFRRAHATECWTLPSHTSMFTGLLPSEHGAHFRSMAYAGLSPTLAESLSADGYTCEMATRNSVLDGTIPGVTRGFVRNERVLAQRSRGVNPLALLLALSKPRFRRQLRGTGFIHAAQRARAEFVTNFARATVPADQELLGYLLDRIRDLNSRAKPWFIFANLYDIHAPYPPTDTSIFRPWWPLGGARENLAMLRVLPLLSEHRYLQPGFEIADRHRLQLLGRYGSAVVRVDAMLEAFWRELTMRGVLDDTLIVVTSDHGEAFGEHELYLHDASVFQTHLHVPLFVHHPRTKPARVEDIVSTRSLHSLMLAMARGDSVSGTLLDPSARARRPFAMAEHMHYPHAPRMASRYRRDLKALVLARRKIVRRGGSFELYDVARDPDELRPEPIEPTAVGDILAVEGVGDDDRTELTNWLLGSGDSVERRMAAGGVTPRPRQFETMGSMVQ